MSDAAHNKAERYKAGVISYKDMGYWVASLTKKDLMIIEAEDIWRSRVFEVDADEYQ